MQSNTRLKLSQVSMAVMFSLVLSSQAVQAEEEVLPEYTFMDAIKTGKNMTSFRLRYEYVSQDGNQPAPNATKALKDADGITLRSLIGWQTAPYKNFSFGVQLINVSKLEDHFNDSTTGGSTNAGSNDPTKSAYAKIVDPDETNINQVYVDWTGIKNTKFRLGRQQVNLDNVRFIGDIGFRQVMQTFDGISVMTKAIPDTDLFLAHFETVNQINTRNRTDGSLEVINAKYYISPTESITGYGYLSSFKDLGFGNAWFGAGTLNNGTKANAVADQSNKTFGLRLDGIHPFNPNLRAVYTAEYAKQTDYDGGDSRIDADYYKIGGGVGIDFLTIRLDQELLSSNNATYAFQTPFGTNHLFQGWVDKFLATPRHGIKDTFVTATYRLNDWMFFADYHILNSDEDFAKATGGTGDKYGTEWNAAVTYNVNKNLMTKLEYGKYSEDDQYLATASRIRDTEKLWLTAMYTF
ncbi:MAG TPA: alginate export family protein [Methylophilaceae bacterium]|jgi:hypothetical protein